MHRMRAMTLSYSNPIIRHPYSRKQRVGLPAVLSSSFAVWFGNGKQLVHERVSKLIITGEKAIISKRIGKPTLVFS